MIIREAKKEDAPTLIQFQQHMAMETEGLPLDNSIVTQGVHHVFEHPAIATYYVAELDGEVIACLLICYEWSEWRNGTILWIESVFVAKNHRGKGVYKKLYHYIQQLVAQNDSLKGIRLYVEKSNLTAQRVYEKLGMDGEHYAMYEWLKTN